MCCQGGRFITEKVESLHSLTGSYDLVVNCTGMGARSLRDVQDRELIPIRGQVVRCKAPWIRHAVMTDRYYVLPNNNCVILGGTKQKGDFDLRPSKATASDIWEGCCRLVPSLRYAKKLGDFVGLRPYRPSLRLEFDQSSKRIIHNYGHGGSGVTLCWGSALEVVRLAQLSPATQTSFGRQLRSKL